MFWQLFHHLFVLYFYVGDSVCIYLHLWGIGFHLYPTDPVVIVGGLHEQLLRKPDSLWHSTPLPGYCPRWSLVLPLLVHGGHITAGPTSKLSITLTCVSRVFVSSEHCKLICSAIGGCCSWLDLGTQALAQFPRHWGRQPWQRVPFFTQEQFLQQPERLHLQQVISDVASTCSATVWLLSKTANSILTQKSTDFWVRKAVQAQ